MKRLLPVALVFLVAAALAFVSGVTAAGGQRIDETLSGTSEWGPGPLVHTFTIHGTLAGGTGSAGAGSYSGTLLAGDYAVFTPNCGPVCAPVSGTIDFVTPAGAFSTSVQPGSEVAVDETSTVLIWRFMLSLTIVSGTRSYAHASGDLTLQYQSRRDQGASECSPNCPIVDQGELTGTIVRGG